MTERAFYLLFLIIQSSFFLCPKSSFVLIINQKEESDKEIYETNSRVWFSSQLSWRSSYVLSSEASWHHQHLMSARHDNTDRSGWKHDRQCTTRLLCRPQHSWCPSDGHYPDLWLWRDNHDDQKENPLLSLYENARISDWGQWKIFLDQVITFVHSQSYYK